MKKPTFCPLLKKDCIENKCLWYCQVRGTNPNTGQPVDEWQCAINLLPVLLIENAQQQRSTGAAIESFRNESVKGSQDLSKIIAHGIMSQQVLSEVKNTSVHVLHPSED